MELASLSSEVGIEELTRRYNLLKSAMDIWLSRKNAILCQCPGIYVLITYSYFLKVIYIADQDQHCNGKTDGRSIAMNAITVDQCFVDGVFEGDQVSVLIQVLLKM